MQLACRISKTRLPACLLLLLACAGSLSLHSETAAPAILTISAGRCVWQAGDDPAWAAPNLDDTAWRPWKDWKPQSANPRLWVRCHADLAALRDDSEPSIQVGSYSAYELYLNGVRIGAEGNLRNGNSSLNALRSYPAPVTLLAPEPATLALRITNRMTLSNSGPFRANVNSPLELRAGNAQLLDALRARTAMRRAAPFLPLAIGFGIIGVLAIVLLAFYSQDPSRSELVLLSISCLSLATVRINELASSSLLNYSVSAGLVVLGLGNIGLTVAEVPFFYALARRRMPRLVIALLVLTALAYLPTWFDAYAAANQPVWMGKFNSQFVRPFALLAHMAISLVPFFVFGPYRAIPRRMRPLAALCMLWGAADFVWFAVELTASPIPGVPDLFAHWGLTLLAVRAITTACVLTALLALLMREQRQAVEERATLAGEMHAAQEIQRALAPAAIDSLPGLEIGIAFLPVREVGGDFYNCSILPGHRQRILLGDVSGKGVAAAMTAAVLLGAAQEHQNDSPAVLLQHLNRVLSGMHLGGFATCLCVEISSEGKLTLANAGHLAPYHNGEEVNIDPGLPLGIAPDIRYDETRLILDPGARLVLLSDGIVEAQSKAGELFGFDRAQEISDRSAEEIAAAAQRFGQKDDITVLTLAYAPAEILRR